MVHSSTRFIRTAVLVVLIGFATSEEEPTFHCEPKWVPFSAKGDVYCMMSRPGKSFHNSAQTDCQTLNASLVAIYSPEKETFVRDLMKNITESDVFWFGLFERNGERMWLRKDGNEKLQYTKDISTSYDGRCGTLYKGTTAWNLRPCYNSYSEHPYFCEKRPKCDTWHFGPRCEKQCHCHGDPCGSQDLTGTCQFGCQKGWMGSACDQPKDNAKVAYYCVNSPDHGTYVSIRIDTKGVTYRNIHGLDSAGNAAPWCNDTAMIIGQPKNFVNIKIFMTETSIDSINAGYCAGEAIGGNTYQWPLVIQERRGILMSNDQQLMVTCNFTQAETLARMGTGAVAGKSETPFAQLDETHEEVLLELSDAFTGKPLSEASTGTPVRLQMRYGLEDESLVKGIIPYNCEATSEDGTQRLPLLDEFGCQTSDLVSAFAKTNQSHHIQTEWFPFFAFEDSSRLLLRCSFTFCFIDCTPGCDTVRANAHHRDRRSTHEDVKQHAIVKSIRVITESDLKHNSKPASTNSESGSVETEETSESDSFFVQWTTHWYFFLFTIIVVVLVLSLYVTSMMSLRSSIKQMRRELKATVYHNEILKHSH